MSERILTIPKVSHELKQQVGSLTLMNIISGEGSDDRGPGGDGSNGG